MAKATGRVKIAPLSKELIVKCALAEYEKNGYESISMRALAKQLGVTPMALYKHVKTKDELLNNIASEQLNRFYKKLKNHSDPREKVIGVFRQFKDFMLEEPILAHIIVRQPLDGTAAYEVGEKLLETLRSAGYSDEDASELFTVLTSFTLGFVLQAQARLDVTSPASLVSRKRTLVGYPNLRALASFWEQNNPDTYYLNGLKAILSCYTHHEEARIK